MFISQNILYTIIEVAGVTVK